MALRDRPKNEIPEKGVARYIEIVPPEIQEKILLSYMEPHRAYHTFEHIASLYLDLHKIEEHVQGMPAMIWALLYHDAVHIPGNPTNERESADMLNKDMHDGRMFGEGPRLVASSDIGRACDFIRHSNHKAVPSRDPMFGDVYFFLDLDMAILGSAPLDFVDYEKKIRAEYKGLENKEFNEGRIKFLRTIDKREFIYWTEWGRENLEDQARLNIKSSIRRHRQKLGLTPEPTKKELMEMES